MALYIIPALIRINVRHRTATTVSIFEVLLGNPIIEVVVKIRRRCLHFVLFHSSRRSRVGKKLYLLASSSVSARE